MADPFELRPGVLIDPAAGAAFLMNSQGGIGAIELSSGRALWNTTSAAKPLALFDRRLVAQADPAVDSHALPIVVLDTKNGKVVFKTSLQMPPGVSPSINDTLGASFSAEARVQRDNLIVSWNFRRQTISGIARPGSTPERIETGAASLDLKTHHVETLTAQRAAALRGASGPAKLPRT
ncbi:MAG TPA: hypothetical protein VFE56_13755, partial [Candidatus Binataceae bacterium]|nr:hypothetical protein [Candidatus Binataceae bacterium]